MDVRRLLALAMAYDNRKPGDAAVAAWMDAAERGRWTWESASEAIKAHYAASTQFVMPAHITERVKAMREEAALRALPPAAENGPEDFVRHRQIVRRILGDRAEQASAEAEARSIACPHCHAWPGKPCTNGGMARRTSHPSRVEAAARQEPA